jgi:hypothetical protein
MDGLPAHCQNAPFLTAIALGVFAVVCSSRGAAQNVPKELPVNGVDPGGPTADR